MSEIRLTPQDSRQMQIESLQQELDETRAELKMVKILKFDDFNEEASELKKQLAEATQREKNLRSDWLEAREELKRCIEAHNKNVTILKDFQKLLSEAQEEILDCHTKIKELTTALKDLIKYGYLHAGTKAKQIIEKYK